TYFVFDPVSKLFAPSKYCAYVIPIHSSPIGTASATGLMTLSSYCMLDETDRRFDGNRARLHLINNLGMKAIEAHENPPILASFQAWQAKNEQRITLHPSGPKFIRPPSWY
ncbi:MAG TPA: hypothetical protein DDZ51_18175, partial [Planctomycetaceae bacterium]|nr:hypothetical protein [Planctomycetaceae bacterium]